MTQQPPFWLYTWEIWKHSFAEIYAPLCSLQHYPQWPRHGRKQSALQWRSGWSSCGHTQRNSSRPPAEGSTATAATRGSRRSAKRGSQRKRRAPWFTHVRDIKRKPTDTDNSTVAARGKGCGGGEGQGAQIYAEGRWLGFGGWAHSAIYRSCITDMHTWNLCDPINQRPPNEFN